MKINDYDIFKKLNENYEYICSKYGEPQVFGIFAFGDVNKLKGIEDIEDLKTEVIIFPTFEEVCINERQPVNTMDNGISVKDIRHIYNESLRNDTCIAEALFTDYRIMNLQYELLFEKYFYNNRDLIHSGIHLGDERAVKLYRIGITEILRTVFNNNSKSISFIKNLTDSEKLALDAIIEKIGDEGIVSIAKLCQLKGIPRQTFNDLLQKLKDYKLAVVANWGPKGTYIKISDYRLINF